MPPSAPVSAILHVDMDAFYAAVELLDHPELIGKPVVVGSAPDRRGVVSTASYEARAFGIHSAMPSRTAGRLCPDAVFLPVRMERYRAMSARVMDLLYSYTPLLEQISVDEAFLDVRGVLRNWKSPRALAQDLKARMRADLGLTASVGIASNKFLAKLASDLEKPDGLTEVPTEPEAVARFLAPLPARSIWGVGRVTAEKLQQYGLHTIGDLQALPLDQLTGLLGENHGRHLHELAFGRDRRVVDPDASQRKSISSEHTYDTDCTDPEQLRERLIMQAEEVGRQLRKKGLWARTGQIKLRLSDFQTQTRQQPLPQPTRADRDLIHCALDLLQKKPPSQAVRLIGFGVSSLQDEQGTVEEADLFGPTAMEEDAQKNSRLDRAVDSVRERFGKNVLRRGR